MIYNLNGIINHLWKLKAHYSISHRKSYSIMQVAKMFEKKIKLLKARPGERYASALTKISLNNKIIQRYGKIHLKDYITSFITASEKWKLKVHLNL